MGEEDDFIWGLSNEIRVIGFSPIDISHPGGSRDPDPVRFRPISCRPALARLQAQCSVAHSSSTRIQPGSNPPPIRLVTWPSRALGP
ncbi:hypothetical protein V6N13_061321 [Hibiscus sabdariffa]